MQTINVNEQDKKETILSAISDRYSRIILEATLPAPKTALEISTEFNIPISTTYRRLQVLYDSKLLTISGTISDDGKKFFMYKSNVKQVLVSFQNGIIDVSIIKN